MSGVQDAIAVHQPPTQLQSPRNYLFHDHRSQLPDTRNETRVDVRVLGAKARLPASQHRLILVLSRFPHGDRGAAPELEMVVRQHPVPNVCLGDRIDIGWILAHDTPPL
jgi:hypothetical protein